MPDTPWADSPDALAVVEDVIDRCRRGERPNPSEYAARFPHAAAEVREAVRLLVAMEHAAGGNPAGPARVGEYEIVRRVGAGGMAVVYEAVQEPLGRRVAVKVLPATASATDRERFRREARAAANLHHTHIVPVYDVGEADGVPYFAMQFIPGRTLKEAIAEVRAGRDGADVSASVAWLAGRKGADYARAVAGLVAQAADAVAHAHAQGVLHRDIKPANLLLDPAGTVWVTDFGLARPADATELTAPGAVVGTLRYVAPERFRGQTDAGTDVYALGVTLYELLTLRPMYAADDSFALLEQIRRGTFPTPRSIDPAVPADLETVVLTAVAADPARRYATAAALAADLRRVVDDRPVLARKHGRLELAARWARRNPLPTAVAFALFAGTVCLAGLATAFAVQRDAAVAAEGRATAAEAERRRELYAALLSDARASRATGQLGRRTNAMAALAAAANALAPDERTPDRLAELRDEAVAAIAVPDAVEVGRWPTTADPYLLTADPDGREVYEPTAGGLRVHPLGGGPADRVWPPAYPPLAYTVATVSADGRWVTASQYPPLFSDPPPAAPPRVRVWDRTTGRCAIDRELPGPCEHSVCVFPDGRAVLPVPGLRYVVHDPATGADGPPSPPRFAPLLAAAHPDGRRAAFLTAYGWLEVVDTATWVTAFRLYTTAARDVRWHPDGRRVGFVTDAGRATVVDTLTGDRRDFPAVRPGPRLDVQFGPDGRRLAVTDGGMAAHLFDLVGDDPPLRVPARAVRFTAAGRLLAAVHGEVILYDLVGGREVRALDDPAEDVSYRPDGAVLATTGPFGGRLRDAGTGRLLADLGLDTCGRVGWHPTDGRFATIGTFSGLRVWEPTAAGLAHRERPLNPVGPQHSGRSAGWAADGSRFLAGDYRGYRVLAFGPAAVAPDRVFPVDPGVHQVAVATDGRRFAQGSRGPYFVSLRDAADGREIARWPGFVSAAFDPSGRWLALGQFDKYEVRDATTLAAVAGVAREPDFSPVPAAFDAAGRTLAVSLGNSRVGLIDPADGRVLVRLTLPTPGTVSGLAVAPDGGAVAAAVEQREVRVWDVRAVRAELARLGLDWDAPPLPPAAAGPAPAYRLANPFPPGQWTKQWLGFVWWETSKRPPRFPDAVHAADQAVATCPPDDTSLRVECHFRRAAARLNADDPAGAVADLRAAAALAPDRADVAARHAWVLAVAPPPVGDPFLAEAMARRVLAGPAPPAEARGALGMALAKLGRHADAAAELTATGRRTDTDATTAAARRTIELDTLVACHHRLGRDADAAAAAAAAREAEASFAADRVGLFDRAAVAAAKAGR